MMSTNAISFLLLHVFRDGAKVETMAEALDKLRELLSYTDRDCGFLGDSVDVINHAVNIHLKHPFMDMNRKKHEISI